MILVFGMFSDDMRCLVGDFQQNIGEMRLEFKKEEKVGNVDFSVISIVVIVDEDNFFGWCEMKRKYSRRLRIKDGGNYIISLNQEENQ